MVDENLPKGIYEVRIMNIDFLLEDNTPIKEDLLTVPVNVERYGTAIENVGNASFYASIVNEAIKIESPVKEIITIYSITGTLLYSTIKDSGSITIPISATPGLVFVIKGSVSGTIKLVGSI